MRAYAVPLALALLLFVGYCTYQVTVHFRQGRELRRARRAAWRVGHHGEGDHIVVSVQLVTAAGALLDQHIVARVASGAPDWQQEFLAAQLEAEQRAFHLNTATGRRSRPADRRRTFLRGGGEGTSDRTI